MTGSSEILLVSSTESSFWRHEVSGNTDKRTITQSFIISESNVHVEGRPRPENKTGKSDVEHER